MNPTVRPSRGIEETVTSRYQDLFGKQPDVVVQSPGRINFLGEHTDYNNGFVMPAAIDRGIWFAIGESTSNKSVIYSVKYNQQLEIDQNNPARVASPEWANYLLGILHQVSDRNISIRSFNCVFHGDLPTGAGLSSSAAMECGFVFAIDRLLDLRIPRREMIDMAQWAEHHYVGVKCGIMDQFASMMGQKDHVIALDCQTLDYSYFPIDLSNHSIVLCDSGVKHTLASSEYNTRREECERGVQLLKNRFPWIASLRDVTPEMIITNKSLLPQPIFNRCLYVTQENERVKTAQGYLTQNNLQAFGELMFQTHTGLTRLYEVSCAELDLLVEQARQHKSVLGSRMMGGGFGGCTINIVDQNYIAEFVSSVTRAYHSAFQKNLATYIVRIDNGTSVA